MTKKYKSKGSQFIEFAIPLSGKVRLSLNSGGLIDKMRFSFSDTLTVNENARQGLYITSNAVDNNVVGTVGFNYAFNFVDAGATYNTCSSQIKPREGIEFYYPTKVYLQGEYDFNVANLADEVPDPDYTGSCFLLVEYFIEE